MTLVHDCGGILPFETVFPHFTIQFPSFGGGNSSRDANLRYIEAIIRELSDVNRRSEEDLRYIKSKFTI